MDEEELCRHDLDHRFCAVCRELRPPTLDELVRRALDTTLMQAVSMRGGERGS